MYAVVSLFTHTSSFPLCYSVIIVSVCFSLKSCVVYAAYIKKGFWLAFHVVVVIITPCKQTSTQCTHI